MRRSLWQVLGEYVGITLGSFLVALGLAYFLVPHRIAAGGVTGLATIIFYLVGAPVGVVNFLLNVPLFLAGVWRLGIDVGVKTIYGIATLSFFIDLLQPRGALLSSDPLLAAIYGGVLTGVGLGTVFRSGGTTGGTDLLALLLQRRLQASVGRLLLLVDGLVIAAAGVVFGVELALYALISLFVSSRVIDVVQEGSGYARAVLIISNKGEDIAKAVLEHLERGVTLLDGTGAYTGASRSVLLAVVGRAQVSRLKRLALEVDPTSFMVVTDVREALGEGFRQL